MNQKSIIKQKTVVPTYRLCKNCNVSGLQDMSALWTKQIHPEIDTSNLENIVKDMMQEKTITSYVQKFKKKRL